MKNIGFYSGVAVLTVLIVSGGFFFWRENAEQPIRVFASSVGQEVSGADSVDPASTAPLGTSTPQTREISDGERIYQNAAFHFGLIYPDNLQAIDYKEKGGALTASFQDPATNVGFEVYVTPYSGAQVTQERFLTDEPSGTFEDPTPVVIDGVTATKFYGSNAIMGDTCEVWFIRGGYLYEIATYKSLESSLSQIMQTWQFI